MAALIPQGRLQWEHAGRPTALDLDAAEVLAFAQRATRRLVAALGDLSPAEWAAPSRCSDWAVVDVVNHVADVLTRAREMFAAGREGRRAGIFDGFDPRTTPQKWADGASREPAEALARLQAAAAPALAEYDSLASASGDEFRIEGPLGRQPWPAGLLHGIWDVWLHERDILIPLGRPVPEVAGEVRLVLLYSLRMIGYIATAFGKTAGVTLAVSGAYDGALRLDAADTLSVHALGAGHLQEPVLRGDAAIAADALCGRGELAAALDGPADALETVSVLRLILAGA